MWQRIAATFIVLFMSMPVHAQRAIILIRHAEREPGSMDVPLTAVGKKRAEELARCLKDAGVGAIYTTNWKRTKETAQPLADALKVTPVVLSAEEKPAAIVQRLAKDHRDQVVLMVGHSNTIPPIVAAFVQVRGGITIDDSEFDKMFILLPKLDGGWNLIRTKY